LLLGESDASSNQDSEELFDDTTFKLTEEKSKQIDEHIEYHAKYMEYLNNIKVNGPTK